MFSKRNHQDIMSALQNGKGSGQIVLPQSAVDMLSAMSQEVGMMVQMGASMGNKKKKGDQYQADIKYEDGKPW